VLNIGEIYFTVLLVQLNMLWITANQFRFIISAKSVISVKCKEFNVLLNCNNILRTQESLETCRTVFREFVVCLLCCSCMALLCEICSNRIVLNGIQVCVLG